MQKTPLDSEAAITIHGHSDLIMKCIVDQLGLEIKPFMLARTLRVTFSDEGKKGEKTIKLEIIDDKENTCSLLTRVVVKIGVNSSSIEKEPFIFSIKETISTVALTLFFQGHYGEPPATIVVPTIEKKTLKYRLELNPMKQIKTEWDNITLLS